MLAIENKVTDLKRYTLDDAFDYCANITNSHYENFPVASLFLPKEKRPYIQSIYAFSRIADDFADELDRPAKDRLADLDEWQEKLELCYQGRTDHPVFIALSETVRRLDIPIEPLRDLLIAFRRDVTQNQYETFEELLSYCQCSANPVGRLVLMIFGYRDETLFAHSDSICTALQLTNFWQDVAIDRKKPRLYIPLEDMHRFNYSFEKWEAGIFDNSFAELLKFEVGRTREMFYQGAELTRRVEKDLQLELKLVWFGGMQILRMIEKNHYDVFRQRPALSTIHKAMIFLRGICINDISRFGKKRNLWDLT